MKDPFKAKDLAKDLKEFQAGYKEPKYIRVPIKVWLLMNYLSKLFWQSRK